MNYPDWASIANLAKILGTNEPALRLLVSILLAYPIALGFRQFMHQRPKALRNIYCIITGIAIGFFNFGFYITHCLVSVLGSYIIAAAVPGKLGLVCNWMWNIGYLCAGYLFTETTEYDILWTMPQCVLCLRMIGFAYDVYDTYNVPVEKRTVYSVKNNVNVFPNLIEIYGYAFFPASFLIGPQFPLARYTQFIENSFDSTFYQRRPPSVQYAMSTLLCGLGYLIIAQGGSSLVSADYFLSEDIHKSSFLMNLLWLGIWGRCVLYKYMSCWLLTEGACALFGLTYNGRDPENPEKLAWNGCQNVNIRVFEACNEFTHYIQSFNCNTNVWVAEYVYKRLKFLNSKVVSQVASLLFLAVWHGFHSGYYATFFLEFVVVYYERDFYQLLRERPHLFRALKCKYPRYVCLFFKRLYTFVFMGFCLLPFVLRVFDKYTLAFENVYYVGVVYFCAWPLYKPIVRQVLKLLEKVVLKEIADGKDQNRIIEVELETTCEGEEGHRGSRVPHSHLVYYDNPAEQADEQQGSKVLVCRNSDDSMLSSDSESLPAEYESHSKVRYRGESFEQTLERLKRELRRGLIEDAIYLKQRREQLKIENQLYVDLDRFLNSEPPKRSDEPMAYKEYWRKMFLRDAESSYESSCENIPSIRKRGMALREEEYTELEEKLSQELQDLSGKHTRVIFERPSSDNVYFVMSSASLADLESPRPSETEFDSKENKSNLERMVSSETILNTSSRKNRLVEEPTEDEDEDEEEEDESASEDLSEQEIANTELENLPEKPANKPHKPHKPHKR